MTQLTAVLSPAQLNKFKILLQERASLRGHPPGGRGGPHGHNHEDGPPPTGY